MTEREGTYTIPTRLFLTSEQRMRLQQLVRDEKVDMPDLVSRIVAEYLDTLPAAEPLEAIPAAQNRSDLRQRRAELARLRARRDAAGSGAPPWLSAYILDLEAELRRLER